MDVNGEVLATSVQRYNIGVNQQKVATFRHIVTDDDGEKVVLGTGAEAAADLLAPSSAATPRNWAHRWWASRPSCTWRRA